MNREDLLAFIAKAHRNTFAAPDEIRELYKCKKPRIPGHKEFCFDEEDWEYWDSYGDSLWAPGQEIISFKDIPVWRMNYQGRTLGKGKEIFPFLRRALMNFSDDMPFRGPKKYQEDNKTYSFNLIGDVETFTGLESVTIDNKTVFYQNVMGGTYNPLDF